MSSSMIESSDCESEVSLLTFETNDEAEEDLSDLITAPPAIRCVLLPKTEEFYMLPDFEERFVNLDY